MAKLLDKYRIQADEAGEVIDLREVAEFDKTSFDEFIRSEIEAKLSAGKNDLENEIINAQTQKNEAALRELKLEFDKKIAINENNLFKEHSEKISNFKGIILELETKVKQQEKEIESNFELEQAKLIAQYDAQIAKLESNLEIQKMESKSLLDVEKSKLDTSYIEKITKLETQINSKNKELDMALEALKSKLVREHSEKVSKMEIEQLKNSEVLKNQINEIILKNEKEISKKSEELTNLKEKSLEVTFKYQQEIESLKNDRRRQQIKTMGDEFEADVAEKLRTMDLNNPNLVERVSHGQSGADIIFNVFNGSSNVGKVIIECKTSSTDNKYNNNWTKKLISDAVKINAKYKILVTYASHDPSYDNLPYWIEDSENNVFIVRPEYIEVFVNLFSQLIIKESIAENLLDDKEMNVRLEKIDLFVMNELPKLERELNARVEKITKKCSSITKAADSIESEARNILKKEINSIIDNVKNLT